MVPEGPWPFRIQLFVVGFLSERMTNYIAGDKRCIEYNSVKVDMLSNNLMFIDVLTTNYIRRVSKRMKPTEMLYLEAMRTITITCRGGVGLFRRKWE